MKPEPLKSMLVLGGCRSGKSRFAEMEALRFPRRLYVATLAPGDDAEMRERIHLHRERRGSGWRTVEEPSAICQVLEQAHDVDVILVDCLTIWITNLLLVDSREERIRAEVQRLAAMLPTMRTPILLVANEVGLGLVPETALGRRFRDLAGWANQQLAAVCSEVYFVAAGLPLPLKGPAAGGT